MSDETYLAAVRDHIREFEPVGSEGFLLRLLDDKIAEVATLQAEKAEAVRLCHVYRKAWNKTETELDAALDVIAKVGELSDSIGNYPIMPKDEVDAILASAPVRES